MLIPWSQELRELLGEDFDNTNFNIDEAINYIGRLRDKGEYKSQYYKIKALKKYLIMELQKDITIMLNL